MKKLFSVLLTVGLALLLAVPVFADVLPPYDFPETEISTAAVTEPQSTEAPPDETQTTPFETSREETTAAALFTEELSVAETTAEETPQILPICVGAAVVLALTALASLAVIRRRRAAKETPEDKTNDGPNA
ncbi:MAG: hypothetical protein IJT44_01285 [Clostridia bacterium]|nr:hypothetical protein [Clostridia bacterium]